MGLEVQGKIMRRKHQQELRSDANEENIFFFIYARFEVFRAGWPTVALVCVMVLYKMDNRVSKFPANTMLLSSRRVEIPNRRRYTSFRLLKTRKGRFFETLRLNYPKRSSIITQKKEILLFPYSYKWAREVLSVPIRPVLCIRTYIMECKKFPCVGRGRIWMAFSSYWYRCKHERFVIHLQQSTTLKQKV